ncbi:MAG: MotB family protein [Brucellaceae bacterium]|nr:MotB family protein [Brucellaceae bacterium]
MKADAEGKQEIIIVRRGNMDDEEGHHGGVWKIAFADFMTAMMCFFLVMWLINAANEQTRAALASYFNPVKLVDRNTARKGIGDLDKGPESSSVTGDETRSPAAENAVGTRMTSPETAEEDTQPEKPNVAQHTEDELFADPYAVLSEIAGETEALQNVSARGDGGAQDAGPSNGAQGGESYRDPFAPDFWTSQIEVPEASEESAKPSLPEGPIAADLLQPPPEHAAIDDDPFAPKYDVEGETDSTLEEVVAEITDSNRLPGLLPEEPEVKPEEPTQAPPGYADDVEKLRAELAAEAEKQKEIETDKREAMAEDIREQIAQSLGGISQDGISVTPTDTGVLISVADNFQDGMFEIGSAIPRRSLVLAMAGIGQTLRSREGKVVINGHTDGRPFAGDGYDNWRLSTARAHATYYMLVRGGLDEQRVTGVAGYADRQLKLPEDPFASVNRRIEILLETNG